ncbi:dephospho-CoA kinase [Roseateles albus]|uniref:Dephospho-CoA kinase n=1 Tax=Roseateles albus TaxID=2987525 RepID=A0ABT5KF34_9BURK|nr:dephospho-CoA kinase [Roseateles albus]MDC8771600.1 dephospho-CoA kinase [Roseateles albus]
MKIGLTGGIGSGKSTVANFLREAGAAVIDTDAIARQLSGPGGAAMPAIATEFGPAMLTTEGALNRVAMRDLAFSDPSAKQRLEAVLHPLIGAQTLAESAAAEQTGARLIIFDVPLLVESGRWRHRVARVLVVDCTEQTQLDRVAARPGWTLAAAAAVLAAQASRAQRRASADALIYNEGLSLGALKAQVLHLADRWHPAK